MTATNRLSDEIIRTLRQFGLPHEGLIRNADLVKAKIFKHKDYHGLDRLKAIGFPAGRWLGSNTRIYTPLEIGTFLANLPTERPVQPKAERLAAAKSPKVRAKRATPKKRRSRR